jgi:phosphoglycerate dehydrogenase-like enzyme
MNGVLTIWSNARFPEAAMAELKAGIAPHRLLLPSALNASNLAAGQADPLLAEADIALGQPDPDQVIELPNVRWAHLTTAGYTRYDTDGFRSAMTKRGAILTNSSMVYDEPCAEHIMAMLMAICRRLPHCGADQAVSQSWRSAEHRRQSRLLESQTVLILGFGAIARRLVELLAPFKMNIMAIRRQVTGKEPIQTFPFTRLAELLPQADHVLNILPANAETEGMFNADHFGAMKPTAYFYNIGRGSTVDKIALRTVLETHRIAGAYLDVTDPEPLPPDSLLWRLPHCWITPHTAGGHEEEFHRLARHFLDNLKRFERGEPLLDRVV